jgi:hypothetical protein
MAQEEVKGSDEKGRGKKRGKRDYKVILEYVPTEDAEERLGAAFNIIFDAMERESSEPETAQLTLF